MGDNAFFSLDGPLDALPADRQMRAANLIGFTDLVRSRGCEPRDLLERHGLDHRLILDPDAYISCQALVDLLEHCSTHFNDPLFGLHLAQLQQPDLFGAATALCRAAPTFRDALTSFIEFLPIVHSPVTLMELVEGRETSEFRWCVRSDLGQNQQANYQAVALDMDLLKMIGGPGFRANYVSLSTLTRSRDLEEIERRVGARVHTHCTTNAIAFPTAVLDRPVATANRLLYRLIGGYLDRVQSAQRKTVVDRVEDYVRGSLASGHCSIEHCAKKLGTSVRTLQANLAEAGLRFSDILERQRIQLARGYLERESLSLDEIAEMLGYAEQSSFGRAFKRWTGVTPQAFRRDLGHA